MSRIAAVRQYIRDAMVTAGVDDRYGYYSHVESVAALCAMLASKRGENPELATMVGLLHDIHTIIHLDSANHAEKGAVLVHEILENLNITNADETDIICTAIRNHSAKAATHSPFTEILIDADVLHHHLFDVTQPIAEHEKPRLDSLYRELFI